MITLEKFNDKLSAILDALADNTISDSVEDSSELEEFYLYFQHQFYVLDVEKNQNPNSTKLIKDKEQLNYQAIGIDNIYILNEKDSNGIELLFFLVIYNGMNYLIKANYVEDMYLSTTQAIKASSIEKLANYLKKPTLFPFCEEDIKYLTPFLEKEYLEKNIDSSKSRKNIAKI